MNIVRRGLGAGVTLVLSFFCSTSFAESQDCGAVYDYLKSKHQENVIALPHTGVEMDSMFATHQVCFLGRDVTAWAVGSGLELTGGYNGFVKGSTVAIITAGEKAAGGRDDSLSLPKSALILLRVDSESQALKGDELLTQQASDDPVKSLESFRLAGYDSFNKIVYFEVPAWATASAVHAFAFAFAPVLRGEKPLVRYIGAGTVDWVMTDTGIGSSQDQRI